MKGTYHILPIRSAKGYYIYILMLQCFNTRRKEESVHHRYIYIHTLFVVIVCVCMYIYTFPKFVMLWYDDVLMKGSCEKYVRGYNESELDVDEDNVCKQSRREGNTYKRSYTKYILY